MTPPRGASPLSTVDTTESRGLARRAAAAASDKKASDIRILDIGELLGITDYFVLCSAANDRQLRTIAEEIQFKVKTEDGGRLPKRREGAPETGWIILDYGIVVVHVFSEEQRRYYDLERLWGDAPLLELDELVGTAASDADR